jgi:pilus assembly protein Flp/PilA
MRPSLMRIWRDEAGQDLIEYGLLLGIITLASILAMTTIGTTVTGYFASLSAALP